MKISAYAIVDFMVLILVFAGCSKDEDTTIVGTYVVSQKSTSGCTDHSNNANEAKTCTATDCTMLTLSSDGTFSIVEIDNGITSSIGGVYVIETNHITFSWSVGGVAEVDNATFSLLGAQLIMTYDHDSNGCIQVETYIRK